MLERHGMASANWNMHHAFHVGMWPFRKASETREKPLSTLQHPTTRPAELQPCKAFPIDCAKACLWGSPSRSFESHF